MGAKSMDEQELIENIINKDKESFQEFMDKYSIDILKTISYVLRERQEKNILRNVLMM